uniref:deoxyribose-phosphate aldolase n=1 Tax=Chromera velia CCMP2878 TaxID=1169474 RepID=A0A0G4I4E2_9ALVE|eukprot:Cvel_10867.t1-p1 / transcript=Cvel_10867.t1 / gene=Cvel_10867 / organism=Chromera_velia_CCMP2878 / gene_product=Deoxyribose-phosphate aldolase, putative / transcript_product=Deoxyribose-phosphate aldolase, putative / location=Cvel_scaffold666:8377-9966(-) / protein_length=251 / sequence_SO=supercontig / SO=protein_coding / is_pseudo=false
MRLIDHTSLGDGDTEEEVKRLIDDAVSADTNSKTTTAAVCIWPRFVKFAKGYSPDIPVATVVNFPLGQDKEEDVVAETKGALEAGADEIDLVIDYNLLKTDTAKGEAAAESLVRAVKTACGEKIPVKVILETGELQTSELIGAASRAALRGGADMLKTSTGKVKVNATPEAAELMLTEIKNSGREGVGFKAAGGVRSLADAEVYMGIAERIMGKDFVDPATFRFGSSSLLKTLQQHMGTAKADAGAAAGGY